MTKEEFAHWLREQITTTHSRRPSKEVSIDGNLDLIIELGEEQGGGKYRITFEKFFSEVTARRLRDGERALRLEFNTEVDLEKLIDYRNYLHEGMAALQSLDDLGSEEDNHKAWADMLELERRHSVVETKIKHLECKAAGKKLYKRLAAAGAELTGVGVSLSADKKGPAIYMMFKNKPKVEVPSKFEGYEVQVAFTGVIRAL